MQKAAMPSAQPARRPENRANVPDAYAVDRAICRLHQYDRQVIKAEFSRSSEYGCYDDMMRARSRKARLAGVFTRDYDRTLNSALDSLTAILDRAE